MFNCETPNQIQMVNSIEAVKLLHQNKMNNSTLLLYKKLINFHTFSSVHTSSSHLQTYLLCKIYCQDCLLTNEVEITKKLVNSIEAVKAPSLNQNEQSVKEITAVTQNHFTILLFISTISYKHSHLQFSSVHTSSSNPQTFPN
jgi:hypothetical protein